MTAISQKKSRKYGLIVRLSLVYLGFTLLNVLFFWVSTGSRQMRLISEKSLAFASIDAVVFTESIKEQLNSDLLSASNNSFQIENYQPVLQKLKENSAFQNAQQVKIITDDGRLFYSGNSKETTVSAKEIQLIFKALQRKEQTNTLYWLEPDAINFSLTVMIPLYWKTNPASALLIEYDLPQIRDELAGLFRFGALMILVLLLVQALFGIYLYKTVLKPVKNLSEAAKQVTQEEFSVRVKVPSHRDELAQLVHYFNQMTTSLGERTESLLRTVDDLKTKDDMMQMELDMARSIQESMLSGRTPDFEFFRVEIDFSPLHKVSGDYYDFFKLPDSAVAILLADASGHGVPAALITVMARIFFLDAIHHSSDPSEILTTVNREIEAAVSTPDYLTAFLAVLSPDGKLSYSNAAHKPGVVYRDQTKTIELLDTDGFFVGSMHPSPIQYETKNTILNKNDKLVIYTDGISEAENEQREPFGEERLQQLVLDFGHLPPDQLKKKIKDALNEFSEQSLRFDDHTLMVFEYHGRV